MGEKIVVPNLEAKAADGNPVFTPKQRLERFRQFTKREHKIDITPLIKGEDVTETGWTGKEKAIQKGFIWGVGPETLYQITRAEYKTDPDSIKIKDLIRLFLEYYLPKRNTYHNRGDFFWAKHPKILEKTNRNRERMQLQHNYSRRIINIQIYDSNHR